MPSPSWAASARSIRLFLQPSAMCGDERLHLLRDRGARLVERHMAARADELRLELALRRVLFARRCAACERERRQQRDRGGGAPHACSARWIPASSSARWVLATMCGGTTRPRLSMKNVSGVPVIPNLPPSVPTPS